MPEISRSRNMGLLLGLNTVDFDKRLINLNQARWCNLCKWEHVMRADLPASTQCCRKSACLKRWSQVACRIHKYITRNVHFHLYWGEEIRKALSGTELCSKEQLSLPCSSMLCLLHSLIIKSCAKTATCGRRARRPPSPGRRLQTRPPENTLAH